MNRERVTAIVLAAGIGSRMQSNVPKQYMDLDGKPVLYYSLKSFEESSIDDIVLVTSQNDISYCQKNIVEQYGFYKIKCIVAGGTERYWSVRNGLQAAVGAKYVLIHDGARPCLSIEVIERSILEVIRWGACTAAVPAKDTIKLVDDELYGISTLPRNQLWQIQTPQSFVYDNLIEAYSRMEKDEATDITDDTMIMERYMDIKTKMIQGDYCNIKITTPEDLLVAKVLLKQL